MPVTSVGGCALYTNKGTSDEEFNLITKVSPYPTKFSQTTDNRSRKLRLKGCITPATSVKAICEWFVRCFLCTVSGTECRRVSEKTEEDLVTSCP